MYGVEQQRLGADLDVAKYNANAQAQAFRQPIIQLVSRLRLLGHKQQRQIWMIDSVALSGMTNLYGTTRVCPIHSVISCCRV